MSKMCRILMFCCCFLVGLTSHAQQKSYGFVDIEKKREISHYSFIDVLSYFPNCFLLKGEKKIGPFIKIFRKNNSDIYAEIITSPSNGSKDYVFQWMLLDSDLNIKFLFPTNVTSLSHSYQLPDGITFTYGWTNEDTYGYGVVDSIGRVVFDVAYDDCWLCEPANCVGVQSLDKSRSDTDHECHIVLFGKIGRDIVTVQCKLYNAKDFFLPYMELEGDYYSPEPVTYPISYCAENGYWYDLYLRWQNLWVQKLFIHGIHFYLRADFDKAIEYFSAIKRENELYYELAQKNIEEINKIDRVLLE